MGAIFTDPTTARHREYVDTIIIPVRGMSGWTLYCTSRFTCSQYLVRFPYKERVPTSEADLAMGLVDGLVFQVGRGYMAKFLCALIHDTTGEGDHQEYVRKLAKEGVSQAYRLSHEQTFRVDGMSPGELVMFMLHTLLASGED